MQLKDFDLLIIPILLLFLCHLIDKFIKIYKKKKKRKNIDILLKKGIFTDKDIFTAVEIEDLDLVSRALEIKPELINVKDHSGWSLLHVAGRNGNIDIVIKLIKDGCEVNAQDQFQNTPLHFASGKGHDKVVKTLLEYGAKVNAKNNDLWTPLHLASSEGHTAIVVILLEYGAFINSHTSNGWTALTLALSLRRNGVVKVLKEKGGIDSGFKKNVYPPVKVFISWSLSRSPQWRIFLNKYLYPVFNLYNITFFDYLKNDSTNTEQICQLIDSELAKADVYIRCLDENLQQLHYISRESQVMDARISKGLFEDFLYYETQEASHKLTSPKIRIILALNAQRLIHELDERTATVLYISSSQDPKKGARLVAKTVHELYTSYLQNQEKYSKDEASKLIWSLTCGNIGVRENAAYRLGLIGDVRGIGPLINALHDNNPRVRAAVTEALEKIGIPTVEPLIRSLRDSDLSFRESVVRTLGDSSAVETLISALDDEHHMVQESAAISLAKIGDTRAIEPLISALESKVNLKFVEALGMFKVARAVEPLIAVTNNSDHYTRRQVAEALGMIGEAALEQLITVLEDKDKDWTMRQTAAWALGDMMDDITINPLIAALRCDDNRDVKQAAAFALSIIGSSRAVDSLINVLEDNFWITRMEAIYALGKIGGTRAIGPLKKVAQRDTHQDVRLAAKETLAKLRKD